MNAKMPNIVTGRQLRSARILAGLTQREFSKAVGVNERAVRYWELKEIKLSTSVPHSLEQIGAVLRRHGVIVFSSPTPGVRLVDLRAKITAEGKFKAFGVSICGGFCGNLPRQKRHGRMRCKKS
jgi:DNA-binding XRE family transcriptional regulator